MTLEQLKELAAKATPGPWRAGQWADPKCAGPEFQVFCDHLEVTPCTAVTIEPDAHFIAAFNPEMCKALLECAASLPDQCVCRINQFTKEVDQCSGCEALAKLKEAGVTI